MPSENIYRQLFDASPLARLIVERDAGGIFYVGAANRAAAEYFGVADTSFRENPFDNLLELANKAHIIQAFKVCFSSGVPVTVQVIPVLPGSVRIQSFLLNPIVESDGKVSSIDMMAKPPASDEEALRRERDDAMSIFASVFDASDVGIVVTDHNRRIVRVNETFCQLYGWQPMDLLGAEFTILIPPSQHDIARKRHDDFIGEAFVEKSRELQILRRDGTLATIIASSGVIELSGKRKFRISTVVDITYLKTIEGDLRQAKDDADAANRAKSAFLANMSHELRTPLNAIIGFSDLMCAGTLGPIGNPHYQSYVGDIKFSATHLLSIINDVLDMSKIEAGRMRLDEQAIDLEAVINDVCRIMSAKAKERSISIVTRLDAGLPALSGDERMIRQILLNLLSNAVKFSHEGGTVTVLSRVATDGHLAITVEDEGVGIPTDKIAEVLQPFGQVSDPRVAKGQGTGLGLPLTKAMTELHGGKLVITSVHGKGTAATCEFPQERLLVSA